MSEHELACQQVVELVTDYLDDALEPDVRTRFDEHLRDCEDCAAYLEQLRTTIRVTGRLAPGAVPDATMSRLVAAFRSWPHARPSPPG
jgi:anti-sigma factor RsiW